MFDVQRESVLFCKIYSHCRDLEFEDMVQDEILLQERANEDATLKDTIFEYGLFRFVEQTYEMRHPGSVETMPMVLSKYLKKIVKYLKKTYKDFEVNIGKYEDCTRLAKKRYKQAKVVYEHFNHKED